MEHEWRDAQTRHSFGVDEKGIYRVAEDREGHRWREYLNDETSGIAVEIIAPAAATEMLRLAEERGALLRVIGKVPELEKAILARLRVEWQKHLLQLQELWEIDPDIGAGEILDRLDAALDRICPPHDTLQEAQVSSEPEPQEDASASADSCARKAEGMPSGDESG